MSTAPQSDAAMAGVDTPEQHEWLDEQTANDADQAEEQATYEVRALLAKQS
jgi:hypothetical protein